MTDNVLVPLQVFTPLPTSGQSSADVERELRDKCQLLIRDFDDGPLSGCTMYSFFKKGELSSIRGFLDIPDNPVQIVFRRDPDSYISIIDMINLEGAKPKQIRDAVKYIKPLQERVIGHTRRSDMTKEYNAAYEVIMAAPPAEQAKAKKQVKKVFLANHGEDYSTAFDMAMYRRGYKKQRKT